MDSKAFELIRVIVFKYCLIALCCFCCDAHQFSFPYFSTCIPGIIRLILSNSVPSYMTLYWGVSMAGIDRSVCKEEQTTNCDEDDDNDNDDTVRDSEAINFIPIHSILSGSYESKGPMDLYPWSSSSNKRTKYVCTCITASAWAIMDIFAMPSLMPLYM